MDNSKYTILIVEDEVDLLEICIDFFELEGFSVLAARNGTEALELFLAEDIDIILSDSKMPKMNGLELLNELNECNKTIPPFFLITGDIALSEEELVSKGGAGIISKPFDLTEVINKVNSTLSES
ncbi:response regulator transcription factor [Halobacteriovorax sp.]|uniref:response regulator transcription factor n=1 Tax=Halobacteriovorax sp. TaxID=2020862 RepID=UPI0035614B1E